jgi:hypothetical protein
LLQHTGPGPLRWNIMAIDSVGQIGDDDGAARPVMEASPQA